MAPFWSVKPFSVVVPLFSRCQFAAEMKLFGRVDDDYYAFKVTIHNFNPHVESLLAHLVIISE